MAFKILNETQGQNNNDARWKARGFINLYLPRKDGSMKKLGAIALREADPEAVKLVEWLMVDPEKRLATLFSRVEVSFNLAERNNSGLDLPED